MAELSLEESVQRAMKVMQDKIEKKKHKEEAKLIRGYLKKWHDEEMCAPTRDEREKIWRTSHRDKQRAEEARKKAGFFDRKEKKEEEKATIEWIETQRLLAYSVGADPNTKSELAKMRWEKATEDERKEEERKNQEVKLIYPVLQKTEQSDKGECRPEPSAPPLTSQDKH